MGRVLGITNRPQKGGVSISGKAISDCLQALRPAASHLQPVSEREYIERALRLANWDGQDYAAFRQLEVSMLCGADGIEHGNPPPVGRADQPYTPGATVTGRERAIILRDLFRSQLLPLALDIDKYRSEVAMETLRLPGYSMALPVTRMTRRGRAGGRARLEFTLEYVYLADNVTIALTLVRDLLTATNKPFGDQLRRCELESCAQLFMIEKANHRPPKYHDAKCMKIAHDLKGPERMARSRKERSAADRLGLSVQEYRETRKRKSQ